MALYHAGIITFQFLLLDSKQLNQMPPLIFIVKQI